MPSVYMDLHCSRLNLKRAQTAEEHAIHHDLGKFEPADLASLKGIHICLLHPSATLPTAALSIRHMKVKHMSRYPKPGWLQTQELRA